MISELTSNIQKNIGVSLEYTVFFLISVFFLNLFRMNVFISAAYSFESFLSMRDINL